MAGTKMGGKTAYAINIEKYGKDFYKRIGKQGGIKGHTGGFYVNRELASAAGRVGGMISRRDTFLTPEQKAKIRAKLKFNKDYQAAYKHLQAVHEKAKEAKETI